MSRIFENPEALLEAVGSQLGPSGWLEIGQQRIDLFAEATGDHQWIHTDPERAKDGPFGGTIAHGYLTVSLVNRFLPELLEVRGVAMGVNYGADRLRFPAPVPAGARIRGKGEVLAAERVKGGAVQVTIRVTVEIEGGARPACVVDTISRFVPGGSA
ncbi:MAG: MaoC family dehydratase [Deltaproteobacteria bacterium]|nr:MaoC family dehydratase [Deltaproteobacteria bacterium]